MRPAFGKLLNKTWLSFCAVCFVILGVVVTFSSVDQPCYMMKAAEQYFHVVLFVLGSCVIQYFKYDHKTMPGDYS